MVCAPGLEVDPVKFICLNEAPDWKVGTLAPEVKLMLSLFAAVAPETSPNLNVLVTDIAVDIFDVPVNVNPTACPIDKTVVAAVVVVRTIEPVVPNAIERVVEPEAAKIPVESVKLFRSSDPLVSVVVLEEPTVIAS